MAAAAHGAGEYVEGMDQIEPESSVRMPTLDEIMRPVIGLADDVDEGESLRALSESVGISESGTVAGEGGGIYHLEQFWADAMMAGKVLAIFLLIILAAFLVWK